MRSSGRSSGGSFGGSSRSKSSSSGGTSRGGFSGILGPVIINRRGGGGYRPGNGFKPNGLKIVLIILAVLLVFYIIVAVSLNEREKDARTLTTREPLPMAMSSETDYYTDTLGWIKQPNKLKTGMREFYLKTGVQPHLFIADNIDGQDYPNNDLVKGWMNERYDELFQDEAHLLLLFLDNGRDYGHWITVGTSAKSVIDDEARGIIHDYIDRYVTSDLGDEEMFSLVFSKSANSIMTVYKSPWPKTLIIITLIAASVVILWIILSNRRKKKEQELIAEKQAIELLNTPLDKIEDKSVEDLAKKYKD